MNRQAREDYSSLLQLNIIKPGEIEGTNKSPNLQYMQTVASNIQNRTIPIENLIIKKIKPCKPSTISFPDSFDNIVQRFVNYNLNRKVTFENIIIYLAREIRFYYEPDTHIQRTEGYHMSNINLDASPVMFDQILKYIFSILNGVKSFEKFVIQIPWETSYSVGSVLEYEEDISNQHYYFHSLGIGTLMNMDKFVSRYFVFEPDNCQTMVFKHVARDRFDYQIELLLHFSQSNQIVRIIWKTELIIKMLLQNDKNSMRVFFELDGVPLFYTRLGNQADFKECIQGKYGKDSFWNRSQKIFLSSCYDFTNVSIDSDKIGPSKTVCIDFNHTNDPNQSTVYDLLVTIIDKVYYLNGTTIPTFATNITLIFESFHPSFIPVLLDSYSLDFDVYYACLVLFSRDMKVLDIMTYEQYIEEFFANVIKYSNDQNSKNYLMELIYNVSDRMTHQYFSDLTRLFSNNLKRLHTFGYRMPLENCDLIRIAELRPSHIVYQRPMPILKSRMTKLASSDFTLRVKLFDDGGFGFGFGPQMDKIFSISKNMNKLLDGIRIQNRKYTFLGSSSSQLKERAATLYAVDRSGYSSEQIRKLSGNFTESKNVSKYISQLGLLFSQSLCIFEIQCYEEILLDIEGDIKPKSKFNWEKEEKYCLTDGIGYYSEAIGKRFFEEISKVQKFDSYVPSAYQIRFGGFKGMLVLNPYAPREGIFFRPSMKKFDSDNKDACLLKYAYPRATMLNRPLIMILDDAHKIEQIEFHKIFHQNVHPIAQASTSDRNALLFLRLLSQPVIHWDDIHNAQISILEEPFLRSILQHSIIYRLKQDIKIKERLNLSPTFARCAFGVVDETFQLAPGQIFFRATKMDEMKTVYPKETFVVTGKVMICRNPTMQPGDVRIFEAVDIPDLHHIKDCVVFPLRGGRSHADELSGGDYDGDEFVIFWNCELNIKKNFPAMDFPYGQAINSYKNDFSVQEMIQFYSDYFNKQRIGYLANLHLKIADYHPAGLQSKQCENLALGYNVMLDSAKTGYFQIDEPNIFLSHDPDFMCFSTRMNQYLSRKILGQLYRQCSLLEQMIRIANSSYGISETKSNFLKTHDGKQLIKNRLTIENWDMYREPAREAFDNYKLRISSLLTQTKVHEEAVLFSNCFENRDETLKCEREKLKLDFMELFQQQVKTFKLDEKGEHFLASAWYTVCFEQSFSVNNKPVIGLPWLIPDKMCALSKFIHEEEAKTGKIELNFKITMKDGALRYEELNQKKVRPTLRCDSVEQKAKNGFLLWHLFEPIFLKSWQVRSDQVLLSFWRPTLIEASFKQNSENAIQELRCQINSTTTQIVHKLIVYVFDLIRDELYKAGGKQVFYSGRFVFEKDLIADIVWDILQKLMIQHLVNNNNDRCPTVSTLLNIFFAYLYNLACSVNVLFDDLKRSKDSITDIFLLKYSVFSMVFLNKIDERHDSEYSEKIIADFSKAGAVSFKFDVNKWSNELNVYKKVLHNYFISELRKNNVCFNKNTETYMLLPTSSISLNHSWTYFLCLLSGCTNINIMINSKHPYPSYNCYQERAFQHLPKLIQIKSTGFHVSLALLRLILGHPQFCDANFEHMKRAPATPQ